MFLKLEKKIVRPFIEMLCVTWANSEVKPHSAKGSHSVHIVKK